MNNFERAVRGLKRRVGLTDISPFTVAMRPAYHRLLTAFYGQRGIERVLNRDEMVLVRPAHRFASEDYEPAVYVELKSGVREGATILDIGAHVGLYSVYWRISRKADIPLYAFSQRRLRVSLSKTIYD